MEAVCHTASGEGGQLCREQRICMNTLLALPQQSCCKRVTASETGVTDVSTEVMDGRGNARDGCSGHRAIR